MAEKWTNTSSPDWRWINPKPFEALNHFTTPCSLLTAFPCSEFALANGVFQTGLGNVRGRALGRRKTSFLNAALCWHKSSRQSRNIAKFMGRLDLLKAAHCG